MKEVVKRTKLVTFLILFLSIIFIFFGIYFPMETIMQKNILTQFDSSASHTIHIFKDSIEKDIQSAASLSSRSFIRDKILDFTNNKITFNELANFTKDKYTDGINVLTDLQFAERSINNKPLVQINNAKGNYTIDLSDLTVDEITYTIYHDESQCLLKVVSPILLDKKILGYDVLFFSLQKIKTRLNENTTSTLSIYTDKKPDEDSTYLYYYETLSNGTLLSIKAPKKIIFSEIQNLSFIVIVRLIIFIIGISLIIYFFTIRFMYKKMDYLSQDRDVYKNKATIDHLTGAFTRVYLATFKQQHKNKTCTIAFLDVDNLKKTNDTYGHLYGDKILKTLVECSKKVLRTNDAIIRTGGDEFILIFNETIIDQAEKIIQRINENIQETEYAQNLQFSYGLTFVNDVNLLYKYITEADEKMYKNKNQKKSIL